MSHRSLLLLAEIRQLDLLVSIGLVVSGLHHVDLIALQISKGRVLVQLGQLNVRLVLRDTKVEGPLADSALSAGGKSLGVVDRVLKG